MKFVLHTISILMIFAGHTSFAADRVIFSDNPLNSWITTPALITKDVDFYLNPQGLHRNPETHWFQLGVTKVFKPGGKMLFDFQVSGCREGKGFYRRGDDGDFWLKPIKWSRTGALPEDRLASVACDIVLECEQIVLAATKNKKKETWPDSIESRYLRGEVPLAFLRTSCGPTS